MSNEQVNNEQTNVQTTSTADVGLGVSNIRIENDLLSSLPEDLRNDPTLGSIKDITSLAKSYVSAQRMLGSRIPIPSQEASEEVRKEFYAKLGQIPDVVRLPSEGTEDYNKAVGDLFSRLGKPNDPSGYKFDVPEGMPIDESYVKHVSELAHKANLTRDQFKVLADYEVSKALENAKQMEQSREQAVGTLTKMWGNKFEENMALCKGVMNKYAQLNPEAANAIINSDIGNNPILLTMLADLGKTFKQEGTLGINKGIGSARTPDEAKSLIADINGNPAHPYHDRTHPAHAEAVKKMESLFADAYPQVDGKEDMFK